MSKKVKDDSIPELKFELNRLSGDGCRYKTFIASVSKRGRYGDMALRTSECTVSFQSSRYDNSLIIKLLKEILAKALTNGCVTVSTNYRPAGTQLDTYTQKNMTELMEIVVDNINVMIHIEKLTLQSRLNA